MNAYILCYHALDTRAFPVAVTCAAHRSVVVGVEGFRRQLACLSQLGMPIVSLEEVMIPGASHPEGEGVVLTFDDGHRSNWSLALPELLEAGAVATFYVVAGFVDKDPEYLTSSQLREMAAQNMLIGSHGMTHRWLSQLAPEEICSELRNSKARLEGILQRPVLDLALPGGHSNRRVFEVARECGYRSIATCRVGVYRTGDTPFRLPRLEIRRGLSLASFRATFSRTKVRQLQALEAAKACLRKTCGLSGYEKLRRGAHRCFAINR